MCVQAALWQHDSSGAAALCWKRDETMALQMLLLADTLVRHLMCWDTCSSSTPQPLCCPSAAPTPQPAAAPSTVCQNLCLP